MKSRQRRYNRPVYYFPQSWLLLVAATHGVNVDSESLGHDNRERNRTKQVANQGNANCLYG